jgi:pyruvate/2-oxoglutarate dehydrogenase complex dihydrolipoamide acyltransferase (E2) component
MISQRLRGEIIKRFPNTDSQEIAFAKAEEYLPQVGEDMIIATLSDWARVDAAVGRGEMAAEVAFEQMGGLGDVLGIQRHIIDDCLASFQRGPETPAAEPAQAPAAPAPQAPAQPAQAQPAPAAAPAAPAPLADRQTLRERKAKLEADMRAPQGSEEWRNYWQRGGDVEYRVTLEQLDASTNALAEIAGTAPAQPAAAPAPAPAAPAHGA